MPLLLHFYIVDTDVLQDGNTALHIATLRRDQEVVRLLLDKAHVKEYFNIAVTNKVDLNYAYVLCA